MSKIHICPFCEEGRTDEVVYSQVFRLGRKAITVEGLRKRVCTQCHSESVPGYLHDHNLDLVQQAEERLPGFAPLSALRSLRERWELSQKAASIIFWRGFQFFWQVGVRAVEHEYAFGLVGEGGFAFSAGGSVSGQVGRGFFG